jgi:hypothetical protein
LHTTQDPRLKTFFLKDFGGDAPVADGVSHDGHFVEGTGFDGAFAFEMDDPRALFGLFRLVFADFDEGFDDVIKRVHVVVEHNQVPHFGLFGGLLFEDFGFRVVQGLHKIGLGSLFLSLGSSRFEQKLLKTAGGEDCLNNRVLGHPDSSGRAAAEASSTISF